MKSGTFVFLRRKFRISFEPFLIHNIAQERRTKRAKVFEFRPVPRHAHPPPNHHHHHPRGIHHLEECTTGYGYRIGLRSLEEDTILAKFCFMILGRFANHLYVIHFSCLPCHAAVTGDPLG